MVNIQILVPLAVLATLSAGVAANDLRDCFYRSGEKYQLSFLLLEAIAITESGLDPNAVNQNNHNGTMDIGLMQINSWWFNKLKVYGIQKEHLFDPCVNIDVGAWVLAHNMARYGYSWVAVGVYNTGSATNGNEGIREQYINRVKNHLRPLLSR